MKKAIMFLTDGFEETEAIVPADILRRAGVEVNLTSITGSLEVTGSHGIKVIADSVFDSFDENDEADILILPGGPGAAKYIENQAVVDSLVRQNDKGGFIAAICAAPVTLGKLGLLKNKAATCYPAMAGELEAALKSAEEVVTDGNITTARAAGASPQFGLALAQILAGAEEAQKVKAAMWI